MKNFLMVTATSIAVVLGFQYAFTGEVHILPIRRPVPELTNRVVLNKSNTVALRLPFTDSSVVTVQKAMLELDRNLPKGKPIYLYLNTPGGSISAGQQLIDTAKSLNREVKTISSFAASMGYVTVQSLGERLVLDSGTLMSHRAFGGIEGQIPGELNTRMDFMAKEVKKIEEMCANRLGISLPLYAGMIEHEHWVKGSDALVTNEADRVVVASCAKDLSGEYTETVATILGSLKVTWSECPLISTPLSIDLASESTATAKMRNFIASVIMDNRSIIDNGAVRENYFKYVR